MQRFAFLLALALVLATAGWLASPNWAKLQTLKNLYDPEALFHSFPDAD
jgi:hypothetical protein